MKKNLLAVVFLLVSLTGFAQHAIQSMVFDAKNGLPLELATVRLLNEKDSSFVQGCKTDENGAFSLKKLIPGNYILLVTMLGYDEYRQVVKMENKEIILKHIQMHEKSTMLGAVEVTGTAAQMTVKKDTLEYNATAFKTEKNAVVEDLLKRLPGVEVTTDGKITVNGQEIKKIRVDGKKFFEGDIEMATKNIPTDMVDKVQVYDQKSDMAQLTGIEDDNTERIINLTTKANRKRGMFGNVTGGAGMDLDTDKDVRYDGNFFLNFLNQDIQTAFVGGANNTNTTRSSRGRRGMGSPSGGISETQNVGVNNNSIISPKLKIGGDASLNHSSNNAKTETDKTSYLKGQTYNDSSYNDSYIENYSANMRLEAEWKPDTLNTFIIQPNIGYNRSFSKASSSFEYSSQDSLTLLQVPMSNGSSSSHGNGNSIDAGLNVIYSRKFAQKRGRTVTTNISGGLSQSNNENWNKSDKNNLLDPTKSVFIDQHSNNLSNRYNLSFRTSYVEPLWNLQNFLETSVAASYSNSISEKNQYNKDLATGEYTLKDDVYSNNFNNQFYSEILELNYRHISKDYNITLGLKTNPSQTSYVRHYENGLSRDTTYGVFNMSPTGRLQYNFSRRKFLRFDYRGQTNQPSINQMQPVKTNSNLMNETVGNPYLNPAFEHNVRLFYSVFNDSTLSSLNAGVGFTATRDALVTNSIFDTDGSGKQYVQTVNAEDIPYELRGNIMFNTPIIKNRLHFNTNTSFGLNRYFGYSSRDKEIVDTLKLPLGDLSDTRRYNLSEALSLTFTNELIEVGARGSFRYSNTYNTLSNITSQTYDWTGGGNVVVHLPYNFNVSSDLNYSTLRGYSSFDRNQLIWNAGIDKSFFNNKAVVTLKAFDILHQQLNIRQIIGDNYIQYSKFNTLTSYFMLSFSYKINKFGGSGKEDRDRRPDFNRFGPPDGRDRDFRRDGGGRHDGSSHGM